MANLTGLFRIGRDVELRYLQDGTAVANLALCYSYGQKQQDGNKPAQWCDAAIFGKRAESSAQYLKKGGLISATLSDPHVETFQRNNGEQGVKLVARVLDFEFAGGRRDSDQNQSSSSEHPAAAPNIRPDSAPNNGAGSYDDFDDTIPFNSLTWQIRAHLI